MNAAAAPAPARVLVATDLSEAAAEAIRQADAHARSVGGALAACHVLPGPRVHMLFPQDYAPEALGVAELDERARVKLGELVTALTGRAAGSFEVFIDQGTDYAEIVRRAETWRASRVVVGGHGHTGAAGALLGSVAERVVRYAHCPVLVARPPAGRGLVVAATDLSDGSLPAVEAAIAEARLRGAKLAVLHVIDPGIPLGSVAPSFGITPLVLSSQMLRDVREAARAQIEQVLAKRSARAESTIVEGRAGPTILKYVDEHRPELLVIGTRGRTGIPRVLVGSVAEHVVRGARTSVLVERLVA